MNEQQKAKLCAEFLVKCLSYGWEKKDADRLEKIWWDSEGWKYQRPVMVMQFCSEIIGTFETPENSVTIETIAEKTRQNTFDEIIDIVRQLPVDRMCAQDIVNYLEEVKRKT